MMPTANVLSLFYMQPAHQHGWHRGQRHGQHEICYEWRAHHWYNGWSQHRDCTGDWGGEPDWSRPLSLTSNYTTPHPMSACPVSAMSRRTRCSSLARGRMRCHACARTVLRTALMSASCMCELVEASRHKNFMPMPTQTITTGITLCHDFCFAVSMQREYDPHWRDWLCRL